MFNWLKGGNKKVRNDDQEDTTPDNDDFDEIEEELQDKNQVRKVQNTKPSQTQQRKVQTQSNESVREVYVPKVVSIEEMLNIIYEQNARILNDMKELRENR